MFPAFLSLFIQRYFKLLIIFCFALTLSTPGLVKADNKYHRVGDIVLVKMVNAGLISDFNTMGEAGETKSENDATTVLTMRVLNVMPNGLIQLECAREVKVNAETQYMVVTGMARSNDVASDNSILSTQVADLKIEYYGKGIPLAKQKTGWLTRLMDNIWPF